MCGERSDWRWGGFPPHPRFLSPLDTILSQLRDSRLASGAVALFSGAIMRFVKSYCQALIVALAASAFPASAQSFDPPSDQAIAGSTISADPSDQLAANLMILSQRPRDVNALIGAGLSAIAVGDGNAALGFLARAEELSPANGRIKAALGSALLLVERPTEALRLFGEASALGVSDRELARDRGLAYDLRGDTRRAQRDYLTALNFSRDDEVIRRLALSYGISGERDRALTLLDPLLQKQDQAAWRARAFVLAMNGDLRGAENIAGSVMPQGSSATMTPFLRRLGGLNAAERALAVNFGMIASDGQQLAQVETNDPFRAATSSNSAGQGLIPAGDPFGPRPAAVKPPVQIASNDPRRRPGRDDSALATPKAEVATLGSERIGKRIGPIDPAFTRPSSSQVAVVTGATSLPPPDSVAQRAAAQPSFSSIFIAAKDVVPVPVAARIVVPAAVPVSVPAPVPPRARFEVPPVVQPAKVITAPAPIVVAPLPAPTPLPVQVALNTPPATVPATVPAPAVMGPPAVVTPETVVPDVIPPAPQIVVAEPASPAPSGLGAIIAAIEPEAETTAVALPSASERRAIRLAANRKAEALAKAELAAKLEKDERDAARAEAAKSPARIWVQVAGGANKSGLSTTWKKTRDAAPAALKTASAWSTPLNRTNRLLVGPFKSNGEARDMVNKLNKAGLSVFSFTSAQGQEIEKLGGK